MHRGIGGGEFEPVEERRDRELTLGPVMLAALALGLVFLCGLFFWLGYAAGRRSPVSPAANGAQNASGQSAQQAGGALAKPPAAGMIPAVPQESAAAEIPPTASPEGTSAENPLTSYGGSGNNPTPASGQALVRPALSPQQGEAAPQASAPPAANPQVQPAMAQGTGLMVQIAAVSQPGDANVLVGALRRRGFEVTARREPGDGLIHVQVGPFANRNEANAMCQRLLDNGYNATVVP
jgi:DedD protein